MQNPSLQERHARAILHAKGSSSSGAVGRRYLMVRQFKLEWLRKSGKVVGQNVERKIVYVNILPLINCYSVLFISFPDSTLSVQDRGPNARIDLSVFFFLSSIQSHRQQHKKTSTDC
jgi:hypothetical protein